MIDDMEADTGQILMQQGRSGAWFTFNDGTAGGMQHPPPAGPCLPDLIPGGGTACDKRAAHTFGSGFTGAGAGMGFPLTSGTPYDASMYTGIKFPAMGSPSSIRVEILLPATMSTGAGGTCAQGCGDHFGTSVPLSSAWQMRVVSFAQLHQQGWGTVAAWDPKSMRGIQFVATPAPSFDFWIDDITFY
jgi:hypothetical protein